jgi:putative ABC transport system substrate-binding protein
MKRREFIALLAGVAAKRRGFVALLAGSASGPLVGSPAARAQQQGMPVIGFLRSTRSADSAYIVAAFRQGLKEGGLVEGQNVAVDYRFADNANARLPALAHELIDQRVAAIVTNFEGAEAAKAVTTTVPIVFVYGGDAVRDKLVPRLNRPGGNVTGVSFLSSLVGAKRLQLLRQLVAGATTVGLLTSTGTTTTEAERTDIEAAAQTIGSRIIPGAVSNEREIEAAFDAFVQGGAGAVLVGAGAFLNSRRKEVISLAQRHRLPAQYNLREFVAEGGLMSYGPSVTDAYRQAALYACRILKGEKPADLPVMQSTKFELVINLKTAQALGLEIPPTLLALADEVIE